MGNACHRRRVESDGETMAAKRMRHYARFQQTDDSQERPQDVQEVYANAAAGDYTDVCGPEFRGHSVPNHECPQAADEDTKEKFPTKSPTAAAAVASNYAAAKSKCTPEGASGAGSSSTQFAAFSTLIKKSEWESIELVSRLLANILRQPAEHKFRSIKKAAVMKRLPFDAFKQEEELLRIQGALCGAGFAAVDLDGSEARLELAANAGLAALSKLAEMIDRTRVLWQPRDVDCRAKADARLAELMGSTGCSREHAVQAVRASGGDNVFAHMLVNDGPKDADGKPAYHPSYILSIESQDEVRIREVWSSLHAKLPEYQSAANTICLSNKWILRTKLGRCLLAIDAEFKQDSALLFRMADSEHFGVVLIRAIQKGYQLSESSEARKQMSAPCGRHEQPCNIYEMMCVFCFCGPEGNLGGGTPQPVEYVTWALQNLIDFADPGEIVAKLLEVCDRADRCKSARKQAFNSLVSYSFQLREFSLGNGDLKDLTNREQARNKFEACLEDFVDDHKLQAFTSAFIAPARYYLHEIGEKGLALDLPVHGLNWYLVLVLAALGMPLPLTPHYDDALGPWVGLVDFWKGMKDDGWHFFSHPDNFGKYFSYLPRLPKGTNFVAEKMPVKELPHGHTPGPKAMHIGNSAVRPGHSDTAVREGFALYLERFAYFFRVEFFVRKAFETLNAESKPEHAGFRKAAETLYGYYFDEVLKGKGDESLMEYCYSDEHFMELNAQHVQDFFRWLGVIV